jgi:hypothetical protein
VIVPVIKEMCDNREWDRFVLSNINGTIIHSSQWMSVLERCGARTLRLVIRNSNGGFSAVYPLVYQDANRLAKVLVSLPDSDVRGLKEM